MKRPLNSSSHKKYLPEVAKIALTSLAIFSVICLTENRGITGTTTARSDKNVSEVPPAPLLNANSRGNEASSVSFARIDRNEERKPHDMDSLSSPVSVSPDAPIESRHSTSISDIVAESQFELAKIGDRFKGITVRRIPRHPLLKQLPIQQGDILHGINGSPLDNPLTIISIVDKAIKSGTLHLSLTRAGKVHSYRVAVEDLIDSFVSIGLDRSSIEEAQLLHDLGNRLERAAETLGFEEMTASRLSEAQAQVDQIMEVAQLRTPQEQAIVKGLFELFSPETLSKPLPGPV